MQHGKLSRVDSDRIMHNQTPHQFRLSEPVSFRLYSAKSLFVYCSQLLPKTRAENILSENDALTPK